jgi:hypothetical protein
MSSDVGKSKNLLSMNFPGVDFSLLPENENWWYEHNQEKEYIEWRPPGTYACNGEPREAFKERLNLARNWILNKEIVMACRKHGVWTALPLLALKVPRKLFGLLRGRL